MSTRSRFALAALALIAVALHAQRASAARVLFVSDASTDLAIADVLTADGHDVTTVESDFFGGQNPTFHADLSSYDCIVWSATNDGSTVAHTDNLAFTNLRAFVMNGGNVFVTGAGSVGYGDSRLVSFLGGTGGTAYTGAPRAVVDLDTDLTTGVVDIRGVVPRNYAGSAFEALDGLGSDTIAIVLASSDTTGAQWSIRSVGDGHVAWVAGVDGIDNEWTNAGAGGDGAFNAALRNFVGASTGLASVPGAPRIAFSSPFSAPEGDSLMITVRVTDPEGDSVTFSWDLDGDGTYGESTGEPTVTIPEGTTDGPGNFVVAVQASDGVHTGHRSRSIAITNVAPMITSRPPTVAAIDQHVRYLLTVVDPGGTHDVPTFTLRAGPPSANVTTEGLFDWTPTEAEITAPGTSRAVAVDVDDGDMGTATQTWSMTVIDDHAPSDPLLLYPAMDAPLLIPGIHLAIGNSSDLDGDPITYAFELDSTQTFDSPDLQRSMAIPGDASGITEWRPSEAPLRYGRWYWRISASDGQVTTSPLVQSFVLVPDPTMFPDVGGLDAGPDAGAIVDGPRGCGCTVAAPRRIPGSGVLILGGIGLLLTGRRRRR